MKGYEDVLLDIIRQIDFEDGLDADGYYARYPHFADMLRECFRAADLLQEVALAPDAGQARGAGGAHDDPLSGSDRAALESIAGYRIERTRARGAQGVVYEAVQLSTGRTVALKVLKSRSTRSLRWFRREVELAARLKHPNVVAVYDAGTSRGRPYCAMELVDGVPVDRFLAEHALTLDEKLRLIERVCAGVAHAHQHGVIHRDIKPSNVLMERDRSPRVVDFGLALADGREGDASARARCRDSFAGTLGYAAPEQVDADFGEIGTRTDVYSIGVMLYELLTGRSPFSIGTDYARARIAITTTVPVAPSRLAGGIDRDLDAICMKALEKRSEDRYPSANAMGRELGQILAGMPIDQMRDRVGYVAGKFVRRHKMMVGAAVVIIGVLAGLVLQGARLRRQDRASAATAMQRFEMKRVTDLQTLREHHAYVAAQNRLAELAELTPADVAGHLARYRAPAVGSEGVFEPIVAGMPVGLLAGARDGALTGDQRFWLAGASGRLDSCSADLGERSIAFGLAAEQPWGLGWARAPTTPAEQACEAFLARAYVRRDAGDHAGAALDVLAARRIAVDLGDGVLMSHRTTSAGCRIKIYAFLEDALGGRERGWGPPGPDGAGSEGVVDVYVELALSDPTVPRLESALLARRLGFVALLGAATVTDEADGREYVDLVQLDRLLGGALRAAGATRLGGRTPPMRLDGAAVQRIVDRYITGSASLAGKTGAAVESALGRLERESVVARASNPMLWLVELPGREFLIRLRAVSRRRAVRLSAFALRYRRSTGRWPAAIEEAVPPHSIGNLIDPISGRPFAFHVTNDGPDVVAPDARGVVRPEPAGADAGAG